MSDEMKSCFVRDTVQTCAIWPDLKVHAKKSSRWPRTTTIKVILQALFFPSRARYLINSATAGAATSAVDCCINIPWVPPCKMYALACFHCLSCSKGNNLHGWTMGLQIRLEVVNNHKKAMLSPLNKVRTITWLKGRCNWLLDRFWANNQYKWKAVSTLQLTISAKFPCCPIYRHAEFDWLYKLRLKRRQTLGLD